MFPLLSILVVIKFFFFRGLKALGVRDLTYRLAFLACSVQATNPRVKLKLNVFIISISTVNSFCSGHYRNLKLVSSLARVYNSEAIVSQGVFTSHLLLFSLEVKT